MPDPSSDVSLSTIFRDLCPREDDAELEAALRRLLDEGRRAWPGIGLPPEAFVRHLASRCAAGVPLEAAHASDLYLACACAARLGGAVEAFDRALLSQVPAFLSRLRPAAGLADEVRQVLRERLFVGRDGAAPRIAEYDGRGALGSWVRVIAVRAAIDLQRQEARTVDTGDRELEAPAAGDAEGDYLKRRYRQVFIDALRRSVTALSAEQREILRLHFVDGLTLDELGERLAMHRSTVARKVADARRAVRKEARRLLRGELGLSERELDSLAGLLRSQLELSLPGLLQDG